MAAGDLNRLTCMTDECAEEAIIYCKTCKHMFCVRHNQDHDILQKLLKIPHEVLTAVEFINYTNVAHSNNCNEHQESPILMACELCYQPMCVKCVDQATKNSAALGCPLGSREPHQIREVKQIVKKVEDELKELLSELRVQEMKTGDDMKEKRRVYDEELEENQTDLEKLTEKIKELHQMLDDFEKETRTTLISYMNTNKMTMRSYEQKYEDYQKTCQEMHEKTTQFLKLNNAAVIKKRQEIKNELIALKQYEMVNMETSEGMRLSLILEDNHMNIPISLTRRNKLKVPLSLKLKEGCNNLDRDKHCFTVCFIQQGRVVYSGVNCPVTGLEFTPRVPQGPKMRCLALYKHFSQLYILQNDNHVSQVHIFSLEDKTTQQSVISYPGGAGCQSLVANDKYIIITDKLSTSIKVYTTPNYLSNHLFDIKHDAISSWPRGLALLGDDIIAGDHFKHQVSMMSIDAEPAVKWTCTDISYPTGIAVSEKSMIILVESEKTINVLSFEGVKLSALEIPGNYHGIFDIAFHNDQLALACSGGGVKLYDVKYEKK